MGVTEQLAAFTAHTVYDEVPPQAYARAKDAILDGLGCALVGTPTSTGKIIVRYVRNRAGEARRGARRWIQDLGPSGRPRQRDQGPCRRFR